MSRKNEDFDEFCDPENPRLIKYEDVVDAATRMKPYIINTPCRPSQHQTVFTMNLYYKLESFQKSGSFKERGALNALQLLPLDKRKIGVAIASLGNEAAGLCYHASKLGVPVYVVMPFSVAISKIQKLHSLGAKVVIQGANLMDSQKYARTLARDRGLTYINGRDHPNMLAGYGTIVLEILEQVPAVEAIILPVGSGGLAAAITKVIKQLKPTCLVYGVQPEINPGFIKALEMEEAVISFLHPTLADAIAVPNIGCNAFANTLPQLDKMLLVTEDWIARSMLHLMEKERYVVEGAGACPLAAIIGNLVPELKLKQWATLPTYPRPRAQKADSLPTKGLSYFNFTFIVRTACLWNVLPRRVFSDSYNLDVFKFVVCICSGGNVDSTMYTRSLERGITAEGRLVKFTVNINDSTSAKSRILDLLAREGYNLVYEFQNREWMEDHTYTIEMKLIAQTKDLEHALELKRIIERLYPTSSTFETEPFNDKRTCPCYVRKSM